MLFLIRLHHMSHAKYPYCGCHVVTVAKWEHSTSNAAAAESVTTHNNFTFVSESKMPAGRVVKALSPKYLPQNHSQGASTIKTKQRSCSGRSSKFTTYRFSTSSVSRRCRRAATLSHSRPRACHRTTATARTTINTKQSNRTDKFATYTLVKLVDEPAGSDVMALLLKHLSQNPSHGVQWPGPAPSNQTKKLHRGRSPAVGRASHTKTTSSSAH